MSSETLTEALVDELQDLLDAENRLVKALPKLAKAAKSLKLSEGFAQHWEETKGHIDRLEQALQLLDKPVQGKTCAAMKGLAKEGQNVISDYETSFTRDALLIGAAQRAEHYEIAAYGMARTMAHVLGEEEVAALLEATLEEEAATDRKLTTVAADVNPAALTEAPARD